MRIWLALLAAPVLMLVDQGTAYSMATWMCVKQHVVPMHLVHGAFTLAIAATAFMAWQVWRETAGASDETHQRRHFLAGVATASGTFSALVVLAMWLPNWLLSPCFA